MYTLIITLLILVNGTATSYEVRTIFPTEEACMYAAKHAKTGAGAPGDTVRSYSRILSTQCQPSCADTATCK